MNQDSYKEFKIWDKELNRVYKLLYKGLSAKQKKVLKKKQIRWIKKKEKEAAKEAAQWAGGSGQPLAQNGWYRYDVRFGIPVYDQNEDLEGYNIYTAKMLVRHDADGKLYLYDIIRTKKETSTPSGLL